MKYKLEFFSVSFIHKFWWKSLNFLLSCFLF